MKFEVPKIIKVSPQCTRGLGVFNFRHFSALKALITSFYLPFPTPR